MVNKQYNLLLDDNIIGTTELEKADVSMGVVFGTIRFNHIVSGYDFLKTYCSTNNIDIICDDPEDKVIETGDIPNLKVVNPSGIEIKGEGTSISGMDNANFEITILGIPYSYFEEEFPHHVKAYKDTFMETNDDTLISRPSRP